MLLKCCYPSVKCFYEADTLRFKTAVSKGQVPEMFMEAADGPSKVAVLINCLPFKFAHVPLRAKPSPASTSNYFLPLVVY